MRVFILKNVAEGSSADPRHIFIFATTFVDTRNDMLTESASSVLARQVGQCLRDLNERKNKQV